MKKIVLFGAIVIVVILMGVLIAINYNNNETKPTSQENVATNDNNTTENNTVGNNVVAENNVVENQTTENNVEENEIENNTEGKSDEERAIDIVKKDWGEDNTVSFTYEGKENGKLIVAVRDSSTTRVFTWYLVDLSTNSCEER